MYWTNRRTGSSAQPSTIYVKYFAKWTSSKYYGTYSNYYKTGYGQTGKGILSDVIFVDQTTGKHYQYDDGLVEIACSPIATESSLGVVKVGEGLTIDSAGTLSFDQEMLVGVEDGLTDEETARQTADTTLQTNIDTEVTRAKEAETTLTNTIATLQTTIDELTARVAALENVVSW